MKIFECIKNEATNVSITSLYPHQEALWCAAFERDSLDSLFDITPAAEAVRVIDKAIAKFNSDPDSLRPHLSADDWRKLRGNRDLLEKMRAFIIDSPDSTISGPIPDKDPDDELPPAS
ncbi:hypothetical protein [Nocardia terpenica]|uniref:Uncharacterized protein n=1 Tax=Nocardia terpenica TaxID=455432 RepID=A0A164K5J0_9NOCA|nr:hypothetical protein [Nocardia terpenica]KZM71053.1 hypothetical protein AWN90_41790 [Nocardia terpenica]NQE89629.1 hypothetical protein [Nocardia terpenica]